MEAIPILREVREEGRLLIILLYSRSKKRSVREGGKLLISIVNPFLRVRMVREEGNNRFGILLKLELRTSEVREGEREEEEEEINWHPKRERGKLTPKRLR